MSRKKKAGITPVLALVGALFIATPAFAHVTVNPKEANTGSFAALTFRVPNEKDNATTNKVAITFPSDHPLAFVSVKPVPGWTFETTKTKLTTPITSDDGSVTEAVSSVTWTATAGNEIKAGEYQEFSVSAGPMPDTATNLVFKAAQTYSDGEVVNWDEPTPASGTEPEHPAPTLKVVKASSDSSSDATATPISAAVDDANKAQDQADTATTRANFALILGGVALVVGLLAFVRKR